MHFVSQLYMPKRILYVTLYAKFAIIDCNCAEKKESFTYSFAMNLNFHAGNAQNDSD